MGISSARRDVVSLSLSTLPSPATSDGLRLSRNDVGTSFFVARLVLGPGLDLPRRLNRRLHSAKLGAVAFASRPFTTTLFTTPLSIVVPRTIPFETDVITVAGGRSSTGFGRSSEFVHVGMNSLLTVTVSSRTSR